MSASPSLPASSSTPPPPPLASTTTSSRSFKDSTLSLINKEFQDSVGRHLISSLPESSSLIILCDFPSRLNLPYFHCQIFGLDDFAFFNQAVFNRQEETVIVITQHSLSLRKILLPHRPHSLKFHFYTRTASVLPYELKIIEILHSLPNNSFQKTESLKFLRSFQVELQNQKGIYHKTFDLFELLQDTSNTFSILEIIDAPCILHSIYFGENPDLMSQASVHLATHAVPHTYTNPLQIKVPKGTQIITSSFEFLEHNSMNHIIELLESPCYTNIFVFKAIAASHSSLPEHSQVNFLKITRIDTQPLITLFTQANIHYLLLTHFLLFQASPIQIEKLILSAQELNVSIPPSFVTLTKKISFEKSDQKILAKICLATQSAFHEFQIQREDIGTTSDLFWTPDFSNIWISDSCVKINHKSKQSNHIKVPLRRYLPSLLPLASWIPFLWTNSLSLFNLKTIHLRFSFLSLFISSHLSPLHLILLKHTLNILKDLMVKLTQTPCVFQF